MPCAVKRNAIAAQLAKTENREFAWIGASSPGMPRFEHREGNSQAFFVGFDTHFPEPGLVTGGSPKTPKNVDSERDDDCIPFAIC